MAQRIGPAHSVKVAIQGTFSGQTVVNTFWCLLTPSGTVTQADLDTWTAAFGAAYKLRFAAQLPNQYSFSTCKAVYFADGTALNVLESTQALTGVGTGGAGFDAGLAIVISWLSGAYWRGGKPRTYIQANATNVSLSVRSQWSSTYITAVDGAATSFNTDINALTAGTTITATKLGFVSFFSANIQRVPPVFFAFTGHKIHPRLGHQRRRDGKWLA